jgi:CBS domain containing-hemolysin-like protein
LVPSFFLAHGLSLLAMFVALGLCALLLAAEIALVRVRFSHFNPDLLEYLERHRRLQRLMADPDNIVQGVRLAVALCLLGFGALVVRFALAVTGTLSIGGWVPEEGLVITVAVAVAVALFYLFADLVPRAVGSHHPILVLRWCHWLLVLVVALLRPALSPLKRIGRVILALLKIDDPRPLAPLEIEAQLELLGEGEVKVPLAVQKILRNALDLRELVVSDVLLPRNQVKFFDLNLSNEENLKLARETGHTRFPLCEGDLDRCIGLIHVKDLFRQKRPLERIDFRRHKREMVRLDGEEPLEQAMTKLLAHNVHMALVIDEFRGVEGLLTLEKILEQLVGDIRDEFDADESVLIRQMPSLETELLVDGMTPLHDIEDRFGVELSNDEVSTVSGLITLEMGRIPEAGEYVEVLGLRLEAVKVDETRVLEALVTVERRAESPAPGEGGA